MTNSGVVDRYLLRGIAHAIEIAESHYKLGLLSQGDYLKVMEFLTDLTREEMKPK